MIAPTRSHSVTKYIGRITTNSRGLLVKETLEVVGRHPCASEPYATFLSSVLPSPSPTSPAVPPRSSCGLKLTLCAWQVPSQLFSLPLLLAAIPSEPLPISPFVPAPFSGEKLPKLFASVGLLSGMIPYRLTTRSPKLLDLTSPRATALLAAPHEAAEARSLDLP